MVRTYTLSVSGEIDDLRIRNSLFYQNSSLESEATVRIVTSGDVYFTNNTVVSNTSDGPIGGLSIVDFSGTQVLLANNIFWGNDGTDLGVEDNSTIFMENNNIEDQVGVADVEANNLSVDPMFEADSYTPRFDSPMVDAGTKPPFFLPFPVPFDEDWFVGPKDFNFDDREQGASVDIGAIEVFPEIIFRDGYE